ncbi:MAG: AraC family transcriptional regulator, partial [Spirulina sp. SIO3F2]|nr:AraC family transcriptional regulator [Spirulina sp. SIO3F2]
LGLYSAYIAFLFLRLTDAVLTLLFFPFFSNYIKTPYTIRIWYQVGYASLSQFSRDFRRYFGQSPRQWGHTAGLRGGNNPTPGRS